MKVKRLKTIAAIFCAFTCAFGFAACTQGGDETEKKPSSTPPNYNSSELNDDSSLIYQLNEDGKGYSVIGVDIVDKTILSIPDTYNDLPVVAIADEAFYNNTELTNISIGNNVEYIGVNAFNLCSSLASIRIPASIKEIGERAFANCSALRAVNFPEDSQITEIKQSTFQDCASLIAVNIPNSVKVIGARAFQYCSAVRKLVIGDGVTKIKSEAFRGCSSLLTVTFGNSVSIIEERAFQRCTSLTSIEIPACVNYVGEQALYECDALESITLQFVGSGFAPKGDPDSENYTYAQNFAHIFGIVPSSLKYVNVSGSGAIGDLAFRGCKDIDCIKLGSGVTGLGFSVFQLCDGLTTVILSDSIKHVSEGSFHETPSLKTVFFEGTEAVWNNVSVSIYNEYLQSATKYFYSEEQPTASGNYWRYVNGKPTPWNT